MKILKNRFLFRFFLGPLKNDTLLFHGGTFRLVWKQGSPMNRLAFPILTLALLMACTEDSPGHEDSTDTNADSDTVEDTDADTDTDGVADGV